MLFISVISSGVSLLYFSNKVSKFYLAFGQLVTNLNIMHVSFFLSIYVPLSQVLIPMLLVPHEVLILPCHKSSSTTIANKNRIRKSHTELELHNYITVDFYSFCCQTFPGKTVFLLHKKPMRNFPLNL